MPAGSQSGLTLVEVVVALAIVGVMTGAAVMSLGSADRSGGAETEAVRLAARLGLGVDMALIDGAQLDLQWDERGYAFNRTADGASHEAQSTIGGRHDLAAGVRLSVTSETGARVFGKTGAVVTLRPEDAATPVSFLLDGPGPDWRVQFDGLNASATPALAP